MVCDMARIGASAKGVLCRSSGGGSPRRRYLLCVFPAPATPVRTTLMTLKRTKPRARASWRSFCDSTLERNVFAADKWKSHNYGQLLYKITLYAVIKMNTCSGLQT